MNSLTVNKTRRLKGTVKISGSKNAAIPIICAALLQKKVELYNVPRILDIKRLLRILQYLGSNIIWKKNKLILDNTNISYKPLTIEECSLIRGSYYLIPVMLILFHQCEILLPGGCSIGQRPIDAHIDAIKSMGYIVKDDGIKLNIKEGKLPQKIYYKMIKESVGASINAILLAIRSEYAVIDGLNIEPEGLSLIEFLKAIGYDIEIFNHKCVIKGKKSTNLLIRYKIIPDRMEAMTFVILGLLCGDIKIKMVEPYHIKYPLDLLKKNGYSIEIKKNTIIAKESIGQCFNIETKAYPYFPTDMQPLFGVLFAFNKGACVVEEKIFESRMQIYRDLSDMGAAINIINNKAYIIGGDTLIPKELNVYDLRHGAALLILLLKMTGKINNIKLIDRGYEDIYNKLKKLGANFTIN